MKNEKFPTSEKDSVFHLVFGVILMILSFYGGAFKNSPRCFQRQTTVLRWKMSHKIGYFLYICSIQLQIFRINAKTFPDGVKYSKKQL